MFNRSYRKYLDVEETEEVDGADEHVEKVLAARSGSAGVTVTEAGSLVHDPNGHDSPVADAGREQPVFVL